MNSILVVGHPTSKYLGVLDELRARGVRSPRPSRRERMSPEEITRPFCKVHRCRDLAQVTDEYGFEQVKPAPVWENIGLDLALGNIDQPFWGWADPRTIFALDYWAASIPQLTFVLVYDEPHSVLFAKALARTVRAAEFSNDEA